MLVWLVTGIRRRRTWYGEGCGSGTAGACIGIETAGGCAGTAGTASAGDGVEMGDSWC